MLWALALMQEVLCAQEEEALPKKKEDTPMIRSLRNPLGSHQILILEEVMENPVERP